MKPRRVVITIVGESDRPLGELRKIEWVRAAFDRNEMSAEIEIESVDVKVDTQEESE